MRDLPTSLAPEMFELPELTPEIGEYAFERDGNSGALEVSLFTWQPVALEQLVLLAVAAEEGSLEEWAKQSRSDRRERVEGWLDDHVDAVCRPAPSGAHPAEWLGIAASDWSDGLGDIVEGVEIEDAGDRVYLAVLEEGALLATVA